MPRPKLYDEGLRERLIGAAAGALAAGGPDALSLRAVAAQAGTSTNAVYSLFGGRDELVAETVARARHSFTEAQAAALGTSQLGIDDLACLGRAYRAWALAHPTLYAVMFGPAPPGDELAGPGDELAGPGDGGHDDGDHDDDGRGNGDPGPEALGPLLTVVRALLDQGAFAGADARTIAFSIWASTHGVVSLEMSQWPGAPWAEALFETQLEAIERAWRA